MDFKFSKGSEEQGQIDGAPARKNQSALLVLLLILVGGFSYIYFFTDLIKPQEVPAPAPVQAPQAIKKPLPPRDGDTAAPKNNAAPEAPKVVAAIPAPAPAPAPAAKAAVPAPKPAAVPAVVKPAPTAVAAKPAPAPAAKPAAEPQKPAVSKAPEKKAPAVAVKPAEQKKADAKPAPADTKKTAVEPKGRKAAPVAQTKDTAPAVKEAGSGKWTLQVGSYVLEEALATDLVRVRKAGLDANVQPGGRKKTPMNRLQAGEYSDRAAAQVELEKLKKHTSDAFVVDNGGKFTVYAGSYLLDSRAASEKSRLAASGFQLTLKRVDIAIPTKVLSAGSFADKKNADTALKKLKDAGLKATLKQQ